MIPLDPLQKIEKETRVANAFMQKRMHTAFHRYPVVFSLLTTFGVVSILYGFQQMLDGVTFFREHPYVPLVAGIVILIFTGTLYKKINKRLEGW